MIFERESGGTPRPRMREENFQPRLFVYRRRTSPELSEATLALYAAKANQFHLSVS